MSRIPRPTRTLFLPLAMSGLLAIGAVRASAKGPPIVNDVNRAVNQAETFPSPDPCTGDAAEFSVVHSGVDHFMLFADGRVHFNFSIRGTLSIDRLNTPASVDATGTFVERGTANGLLNPETRELIGKAQVSTTLIARGVNTADGSAFRFKGTDHTVTDRLGDPKVEFSKARCG